MITRRALALAVLLAAAATLAASSTDIDKFGWVSEKVATGGQPTAPQIASLARDGFRTIINLRDPSEHDAAAEEAAAKEHGLIYLNIPFQTAAPKTAPVDAFLKALSAPRSPVFVHCGSANRVAALWMIRRVLVDKWELPDAEREAKIVGLKSEDLKEFALGYIRSHGAPR